MRCDYRKPPLSISEQAQLLIDRGLICNDRQRLESYLSSIGYYRLSAYWLPFSSTDNEQFSENTHFDTILSLYIFDRKLRLLVMEAIERIEVALRAQWSGKLALHGGSHAYMEADFFKCHNKHNKHIERIVKTVNNSKDDSIQHYTSKYNSPVLPPIWTIVEKMTFGNLSYWFENTKETEIKKSIMRAFNMPTIEVIEKVFHALTPVRNACAHHSRLWNHKFTMTLPEIKRMRDCLISGDDAHYLYNYLVIMDVLMRAIGQKSSWKKRLIDLLHTVDATKHKSMGFPKNWESREPWNLKIMNTPTLRFKEFSGAWEVKTINDLTVKIVDGDRGVNYPNGDDFSNDGYCLFLNAKNVTKSGFAFDELSFISKEKDEQLRKGKLIKNDLIITTRGTVGNIAYFDNNVKYENIRINSGMVIVRNESNDISSNYLYQYFYSPNIKKTIDEVSFGSAQPQLTVGVINKIKIGIPTPPEQTKIANFLTAIDEKIAQLSQTAQLLTDYKKGVMQQIFSQQLRFKDDDGREFAEWEEKSLGDLAAIYDGTHMTPDYQKSGIPFYSVEHITSNNFEDTKFISREVFEKENKRVKLEKGDILMTKIGDIGTPKYIDWDVEASFYVSLALIKQSKKANFLYLTHYIKTNYFQHELHKRIIHVAFPKKINLGEIGNCLVKLPCEKEQTKIANFLTAIDDKINNNQTQLDAMKQYKAGLLQQMFV